MRGFEKEIIDAQLKDEKQVINELKKLYKDSLTQIDENINGLMARYDATGLQSVIYQLDYQKALKKQINGVLDTLQANEYQTISDYLSKSYQNGFIGTMYSIQKQGIPLVIPMDETQIINAIVHKSKISGSLYKSLGQDISSLKKRISSEVSRGIANGFSYSDIARNIQNTSQIGVNNAVRIARTEGHRIQGQSQLDACYKAKEKGADVVKQWDASLDGRTRKNHRKLDGQIRELDEYFEVDGKKAMTTGQFNRPEEDINCRCCVLQRAKWSLDEDELKTLEERAKYYELDKTEDFNDYKKKYLKAVEEERIQQSSFVKAKTLEEAREYSKQFASYVDLSKIKNLDSLNALNETLTNLQEKYPTPILNELITKNFTRTGAQANYETLQLGVKAMNEGFPDFILGEEWVNNRLKRKEKWSKYLDDDFFDQKQVKKVLKEIEEDLKYIRHNVLYKDLKIQSIITHEYGHTLADRYLGQINGFKACVNYRTEEAKSLRVKIVQAFNKAKETGDIYKISKYASTNHYEFFAESFTMYEMGQEKLPDYIEDLIKGVVEYGKNGK